MSDYYHFLDYKLGPNTFNSLPLYIIFSGELNKHNKNVEIKFYQRGDQASGEGIMGAYSDKSAKVF